MRDTAAAAQPQTVRRTVGLPHRLRGLAMETTKGVGKMFRLQKLSNRGTSTPAVARTFVQGCEILEFFDIKDEQKDKAKGALFDLQRHLVRCVEVRDLVAQEIKRAVAQVDHCGRAITLPSVPDLHSCAESFLESAKLAISKTASLVTAFYGVRLDHRYHKFANWAEREFGPDDQLTVTARNWEPWVKRIVDMRNAVEHPDEKPGGQLMTENFTLRQHGTTFELVQPAWGLSGEPLQPLVPEMDEMIEGTIELGEDILVCLFNKLKVAFPLVVREIPPQERDPACPVRLRVEPETDPGGAS